MDTNRAFLAVLLSFLIVASYQQFFLQRQPPPASVQQQQQSDTPVARPEMPATPIVASAPASKTIEVDPNPPRDITVDTPLYKAVFFEQGGGLKSFILKNYRTAKDANAAPVELVTTDSPATFPMVFSPTGGTGGELLTLRADQESLSLPAGDSGQLIMRTKLPANGITVERQLNFTADSYLIDSRYTVSNAGSVPLAISPALLMTNTPFQSGSTSSQSLFSGPAVYVNGELHEIKPKKLQNGPMPFQGSVGWAAYTDDYFMCALVPEKSSAAALVTINAVGEETVRTVLTDGIFNLAPDESRIFQYEGYFGPKKLAYLKETGYNLAEAINFGWFDVLAKPMLMLLNFFYGIVGNYGIAIILLTCLIKGAFWPVTQKGMKSMKNMQKLQPKVAKLREKYKDDPVQMNQEMMALYKTYKVNPVGGCLPMVIQIPFFFALYKVLMAAIELRHAPFMLWINDLSAPDRLMIGFDLPYLHGIPVLTVLMGASMFLQQKMTPTTADPTQAKVMQFLPILFTAMFINFASGLVLYWFVNNLLSILQQQLINRQTAAGTH